MSDEENKYCIDCGFELDGWPTKPQRCDICDTARKYEKREIKLHKEIEELKNKIKELENKDPDQRDYLELRDFADKVIVEKAELQEKYTQLFFKHNNLVRQVKTLIPFLERGKE